MTKPHPPASLAQILRKADVEDLGVLVDYLTDSGAGRISLDKRTCASLVQAKADGIFADWDRESIERELRLYGGNTLANLFRGVRGTPELKEGEEWEFVQGVLPYEEIVRDVAAHLKVKLTKSTGVVEAEDGILKALLISSLAKATPAERESLLKDLGIPNAAELALRGAAAVGAGIAAAHITTAVAFHLSRTVAMGAAGALLGKGAFVAASNFAVRPVTALAGPIGWAITGAWALADMTSPAYRVTVPCVVHVAYMRRKRALRLEHSAEPTQGN